MRKSISLNITSDRDVQGGRVRSEATRIHLERATCAAPERRGAKFTVTHPIRMHVRARAFILVRRLNKRKKKKRKTLVVFLWCSLTEATVPLRTAV